MMIMSMFPPTYPSPTPRQLNVTPAAVSGVRLKIQEILSPRGLAVVC